MSLKIKQVETGGKETSYWIVRSVGILFGYTHSYKCHLCPPPTKKKKKIQTDCKFHKLQSISEILLFAIASLPFVTSALEGNGTKETFDRIVRLNGIFFGYTHSYKCHLHPQ